MSKLDCPCGRTLSSTDEGIWRSFASFVLTPQELDDYDKSLGEFESPCLRELWRCACGRIAIDKDTTGIAEVEWYAPVDMAQSIEPTLDALREELGLWLADRTKDYQTLRAVGRLLGVDMGEGT